MSCYHPITAHRNHLGEITFSAKGQIGGGFAPVKLPCGQCAGCRLKKKRDWAIRCMHEAQMHSENAFITLTYNPRHRPTDGGLLLSHWQNFAKRLRRRIGPFRYFHCGEYGAPENNYRPHFHALIYGTSFSRDSKTLQQPAKKKNPHPLRVSRVLTETWIDPDTEESLGFHTVGSVTFDSAAYCASYAVKKLNGRDALNFYRRETVDTDTGEISEHWVRPEYATMSRRPGIGSTFFDKYVDDIYPSDFIIMKGQKFSPPPYYDKLLKETNPELYDEVKYQRYVKAQGETWNQTPARLAVRERVMQARTKTLNTNVSV